jgi:CheY-like chemotaxis protein
MLRREPPHDDAPRPDLIILDIDMPGEDGCDLLRVMKGDPEFRCIPVIMFSAALNDAEVDRCYTQRANACVRKPDSVDGGLRVVRQIESFWLNTARLPA